MTLPTGDMILQTNIDYETCLHTLENLFFPNGKSVKGRISTMETKLGNFHGEVLPGNFFLHQAVARSGSSQKSKLYLLSKKKVSIHLHLFSKNISNENFGWNMHCSKTTVTTTLLHVANIPLQPHYEERDKIKKLLQRSYENDSRVCTFILHNNTSYQT